MEDKRCISCGKKLKYSNGFGIMPSKNDVLFIIDELNLEMPIYSDVLKETEQAERFQKFLLAIEKDSFPTIGENMPDTSYMSEEEWNAWCFAHDNYSTKAYMKLEDLPRHNNIPEALNQYYCNEHCFKKHLKLAKKQAKKHLYKQKSPKSHKIIHDYDIYEELPMSKIRDILIEKYGECRICGDDRAIEAHHIIAKENGGKNTLSNVIPLCPTCHNLSHGRGVINNG